MGLYNAAARDFAAAATNGVGTRRENLRFALEVFAAADMTDREENALIARLAARARS